MHVCNSKGHVVVGISAPLLRQWKGSNFGLAPGVPTPADFLGFKLLRSRFLFTIITEAYYDRAEKTMTPDEAYSHGLEH